MDFAEVGYQEDLVLVIGDLDPAEENSREGSACKTEQIEYEVVLLASGLTICDSSASI